MYITIKLKEKDSDLIEWLETIDKEARSFVIKSILRMYLKKGGLFTQSFVDTSTGDQNFSSEIEKKIDSMF